MNEITFNGNDDDSAKCVVNIFSFEVKPIGISNQINKYM